jgi:hypothetical protein
MGGIAYMNSFSWSTDTPCFAFIQQLGPNWAKWAPGALLLRPAAACSRRPAPPRAARGPSLLLTAARPCPRLRAGTSGRRCAPGGEACLCTVLARARLPWRRRGAAAADCCWARAQQALASPGTCYSLD